MKTIAITTLAAGAMAMAALGLAGTATAVPNVGTVEDTVNGLSPLSRCIVTGMHPTLPDTASVADKQNTTVFVNMSCPFDR